jgi:hypothetical protein
MIKKKKKKEEEEEKKIYRCNTPGESRKAKTMKVISFVLIALTICDDATSKLGIRDAHKIKRHLRYLVLERRADKFKKRKRTTLDSTA